MWPFWGRKPSKCLLFLVTSKLGAVEHFQDWSLSCIIAWLMEKEVCKSPSPELWFVLRFAGFCFVLNKEKRFNTELG